MMIVREIRKASGLTQSELAELGGTSQPTIAAYESGAKVPNLKTLRRLAEAAGFDLRISVTPAMTREERRSLWLHRTIAERLRGDPDPVLERARSNLGHMRELHPGAGDLLDEWSHILDGSVDQIADILTDTGVRARELRQVTPFAGVLDAGERAWVYREFREAEASG